MMQQMEVTFLDASASSKMHDTEKCWFILMHPKKVTQKKMHSLSYA
jgi:hypothetical protein